MNRLFIIFVVTAVFLLAGYTHNAVAGQSSLPLQIDSGQDLVTIFPDDHRIFLAASRIGEEFVSDEFDDTEADEAEEIADPLAPWNVAMFHFNDKLYFWVLKPVSHGYKAITPTPVRIGVDNFFTNLGAPVRIVNSFLQGKVNAGGVELSKFLLNTTVGLGGLWKPSDRHPELKPISDEDLGQTLGHYNIGNGFYIVWPFLGSSTLRDSIGLAGDFFLNPVSYVDPFEASLGITALNSVNSTSFRLGDYETFKAAAIIPYEAFRDAYIQHRASKVKK